MSTRSWLWIAVFFMTRTAWARDVPVADATQLAAAIGQARAGDVITLAAGTYRVAQNLECSAPGQPTAPIVVRAAMRGGAAIEFDTLEGFKVSAPYWLFEGLAINGVCPDHSSCEHAFHLFGNADGTVIRKNRVRNFNAQIKSNGMPTGVAGSYPDDVVIENNELFDDAPRQTDNPVTKLDVVGGRRWVVRGNSIHDFTKGGGDGISYGAFLKGDSKEGLFERNLVECASAPSAGTRIGLSFGGGGTDPSFCEDGACAAEHEGGLMRNNLILNCSDVGIYVNKGSMVRLYHNTLYATTGIDVRFTATSADVRNNLIDGRIRTRDGARLTTGLNAEDVADTYFETAFADPAHGNFALAGDGSMLLDLGDRLMAVMDDYCGNPRVGPPDFGAVEYGPATCDTRTPVEGAAGGGAGGGVGGGGAGGGGAPSDGAVSDGALPVDAGAPDAAPVPTPGPAATGTLPQAPRKGSCSATAGDPAREGVWLVALALLALWRRPSRR